MSRSRRLCSMILFDLTAYDVFCTQTENGTIVFYTPNRSLKRSKRKVLHRYVSTLFSVFWVGPFRVKVVSSLLKNYRSLVLLIIGHLMVPIFVKPFSSFFLFLISIILQWLGMLNQPFVLMPEMKNASLFFLRWFFFMLNNKKPKKRKMLQSWHAESCTCHTLYIF